jgi:membrane dipeptidase
LIVIDGHCDTVLDVMGKAFAFENAPPRDFLARGEQGMLDLPRLVDGGVTCQIMALFINDKSVAEATPLTHSFIDALEGIYARTDRFFRALKADDITAAKRDGRVASLLSIEGGEAIGGPADGLDTLQSFFDRGVRLMGLTWNRRNAIARGAGSGDPAVDGTGGLTDFGRQVVARMEKLGMVVDASHLSDEALVDLLAVAERPVVASHSNSRELCGHRRNLTDALAEGIAKTGGLIGLCFAGIFLDPDPVKVTVSRIADHAEHLWRLVGPDHVGLGSDFDGFTRKYGVALESCAELPELTAALLDRGIPEADVAKIMGGNWLRVIREIIG